MTSSSTPLIYRPTRIMSTTSYKDFMKTSFMSKLRNVSFTSLQYLFWATFSVTDIITQTLRKSKLLKTGPLLPIRNNYNYYYPILRHPDHQRQFIVEVDASDIGPELFFLKETSRRNLKT